MVQRIPLGMFLGNDVGLCAGRYNDRLLFFICLISNSSFVAALSIFENRMSPKLSGAILIRLLSEKPWNCPLDSASASSFCSRGSHLSCSLAPLFMSCTDSSISTSTKGNLVVLMRLANDAFPWLSVSPQSVRSDSIPSFMSGLKAMTDNRVANNSKDAMVLNVSPLLKAQAALCLVSLSLNHFAFAVSPLSSGAQPPISSMLLLLLWLSYRLPSLLLLMLGLGAASRPLPLCSLMLPTAGADTVSRPGLPAVPKALEAGLTQATCPTQHEGPRFRFRPGSFSCEVLL